MMEREKAVVLLLTCLIFLFEIQATDIEVKSSDGKIRYKYVGCYRDHGLNRTLPWHYFNAKKYVNWHKEEDYNFKEVIDMCAVHAHSRSDLSFFGVQFFGECWGGGVDAFYNRFGKSKDCLEFPGVPGVGKSWTNAVYKIVFECEVKGVRYRDGESFYIPQNPINYNDIGCQNCSCDRGVKNCNRNIKCHFFFSCHKFIPASQGQCCPTCDSDSDLDKEQRNANHRGAEEGDSASVSTVTPSLTTSPFSVPSQAQSINSTSSITPPVSPSSQGSGDVVSVTTDASVAASYALSQSLSTSRLTSVHSSTPHPSPAQTTSTASTSAAPTETSSPATTEGDERTGLGAEGKTIGALEIVGFSLAGVIFLLVVAFTIYYFFFRMKWYPQYWTHLEPEAPPPGPEVAAAKVAAVAAAAAGPRENKALEVDETHIGFVGDSNGPLQTTPQASSHALDGKAGESAEGGEGKNNEGYSEDSAL